jgi:hypothetical protein
MKRLIMKNVFNTINTTFELNIPVESLNLILMADGESSVLSNDDIYMNTLIAWAYKCEYELLVEVNEAIDDAYVCYIRKQAMAPDRCVKAFIYTTKLETVEAACKWLNKTYVKRCANIPEREEC